MIVVTTPTGDIGSQVLEGLLGAGEAIRVIVRDPARLSAQARDQAEVVRGSHGDPEVVTKAFAGADAVFWVAPPNRSAETIESVYAGFARPACEAFISQGVGRVVGVSALGRGWPAYAGHVTASLAMDDLIAGTGVSYRALAMPTFMDVMLRQAPSIRDQGVFYSAISADRKLPTVATRDIAAVATRLLLDDSWSGQESVPVLGPEDLSNEDLARIMSDVLGKPVRFRPVPAEAFRETLTGHGASPANADAMVAMMVAKDEGMDNMVTRTPESATPTTFRQWCEDVLRPAVLD